MSIVASDIFFRKSLAVTDTTANGGRKGYTEVQTGIKHNLFPRVTKAERTAGVTRYRKEFFSNEDPGDETAYEVLVYLEFPSNGDDRFYIGTGTQEDTQGDIVSTPPVWVGCGKVNADVVATDTDVDVLFENNDYAIPNASVLHISDKYKTGQTMDSDVKIGDSCEFGGGTWSKIAATDDINYPKGIYVGGNVVMTVEGTTKEEWVNVANVAYVDEDIGNGDGTNNPALSTLSDSPICKDADKLPQVTTLDTGDNPMTVNIAADGSCSGDCTAGTLNMETGAWTATIVWTANTKSGEDILIDYSKRAATWAGNVATIDIDGQFANGYAAANSYVGIALSLGDIEATSENWVETTTSGTYDEATYPVVLNNRGTVEDSFTIQFSDATNFTCSGANEGSLGAGVITSDFSPTNPNTGQPYFTIDKDGWGGTWANGETVEFDTHPAAGGIWFKEVVPAASNPVSENLTVLGWYAE